MTRKIFINQNSWLINKKKKIKINRQLRDIIHGYIMSDGYVKPNGILTVDQSLKQEKFVMWLYEKFKPIRTDSPIRTVIRRDKLLNLGGRVALTKSSRFNTRSVLHGFYAMWYKEDPNQCREALNLALLPRKTKKCLPKGIDCFFSPEFISLWFAGDGTKTLGSKGAKFEVTAFSPCEREKLKTLFKIKYNINASINRAGTTKKGTEQWTINIGSNDYAKFRTLITKIDLIPKLFPNKLHPLNS